MDISTYFEPISLSVMDYVKNPKRTSIGDTILTYVEGRPFPTINEADIAIVGLTDDRNAIDNAGCGEAPDVIRHYLYRLALPNQRCNMVDLGNLIPGHSVEDSYYAASEVLYKLFERNITVIMIGASQDFTFAAYKAYEVLGRIVNICDVDARFDLGDGKVMDSRTYIGRIIMEKPNFLFDFCLMGLQSYFEGFETMDLIEQLKFDQCRLGMLQQNIERTEPLVRNADMVSVDIGAVRMSDAPGNGTPSPHGLYGEELCQITRFAGMSDKTSCIGFHEVNPSLDNRGQTSQLVAHAIWYFVEGFYHRVYDQPEIDRANHKRFMVEMKEQGLQITFHKSKRTDRWWMEVPCEDAEKHDRYLRHILVPCNYSDYEQALENEIPDLWWHVYNKINE